ncbi:MAG TPA: hypothetical protein VF232_05545 [Gaiellaceae bacterium]
MSDSRTSQARTGRRRRGIAELGAARRPRPQRPELAVAAHPRIAYHYDVGNERYRLMLYETKSEAGFRTRWLRDAQLVLA